jgi:hypothetical protein
MGVKRTVGQGVAVAVTEGMTVGVRLETRTSLNGATVPDAGSGWHAQTSRPMSKTNQIA